MAVPTLALESPAGLACIAEGRTYAALEPGRETAVELDVHAESGMGAVSRAGNARGAFCPGRFEAQATLAAEERVFNTAITWLSCLCCQPALPPSHKQLWPSK
jgi:hypothetical protein